MSNEDVRPMSSRFVRTFLVTGLLLPGIVVAGYLEPSTEIAALLDARPNPAALVAPGGEWLAILERPRRPSIAELARPTMRLAGERFDAANLAPPPSEPRGPARPSNRPPPGSTLPAPELEGRFDAIDLMALAVTGETIRVKGVPAHAWIMHPSWSPDGQHLAFTAVLDDHSELWVVTASGATARKLSSRPLNSIGGWPCHWRPDSRGLLCRSVGAATPAPSAAIVPTGPVVQEHSGPPAPARTFQNLLQNAHDEALLAHYLETQLLDIFLVGRAQEIGAPGMHIHAEYSPDGHFLLVKTLRRPFSYTVPMYRFAASQGIWDARGKPVYELADLPLAESIPLGRDSVRTGPRVAGWRSDTDATVYWVSAVDDGDARNDVAVRDAVFMLAAPFKSEPVLLAQLSQRFLSVQWSGADFALVWDDWWQTRKRRAFGYRPDAVNDPPQAIFDFSIQDAYADPGKPIMTSNAAGFPVLLRDAAAGDLLLDGFGATPEGDRPFVNRFDIGSGKTTELWRSAPPHYEEPVAILAASPLRLVTLRESLQTPPTLLLHTSGSDEELVLQKPADPYPALAGMHSELLRYQRDDGVWLSARLYLPAGYSADDGPLPAVLWAYPLEYRSIDDASQVTGSPHRFPLISLRSMLPWLTAGYAIMDDVAMPVVGEAGMEPNDTYVEQIVASATAAIAAGARRGVVDPDRVAIAGHSYGAFMTANLLAYTDLFRAGIARSGAYNRTLTPFGFQREERTVWEAPDLYARMSPFMQANKIDAPLLLIHGVADENSGTHPLQSERLFSALQGLGKDSRLVLLPLEGHTYLARESVLHQAAEISAWLARHLREPDAPEPQ